MRFVTLFLILISTSTFAEKITGKVLRVLDGDTIEISYKKSGAYSYYSTPAKAIIRLNGIDAPESNQPGGRTAKNTLINLTHQKEIVAVISSKDKHGRLVGDVYAKEESLYSWNSSDADMQFLNLEMIKRGMAWHYKQYSSNPAFAKAEATAKKEKVGIWKSSNPTPPWEWRIQEHPPSKTISAKGLQTWDVERLMKSGTTVIVDNSFQTWDIEKFLNINPELVVVRCRGFQSWDVTSFLKKGAEVIVDKSFQTWDIKSFIGENSGSVTVIGRGFQTWDIKEFLEKGGHVVVDSSFQTWNVKEFIQKNPSLVTILGKGFQSWDINEFESLGGRILK